MKKIIFMLSLVGVLILTACNSTNQEGLADGDYTDSETKNIEAAKTDLSASEFDQAIEDFNKENAELNNTENVDMLNGATYEAYLLVRANLSEEHFEAAQEEKVFATEITYEDYKGVAEGLNNREEFEKTMLEDDEKESAAHAYGAYAAKTTQYLTPEGSNN